MVQLNAPGGPVKGADVGCLKQQETGNTDIVLSSQILFFFPL